MDSSQSDLTFELKMAADGSLTGTFTTFFSDGEIVDGKYDPENNKVVFTADAGQTEAKEKAEKLLEDLKDDIKTQT